MEILIVAEDENQTRYWEKLIALVVPQATITPLEMNTYIDESVQNVPFDLMFVISNQGNELFYQWLDYTNVNEIPMICSVEKISSEVVEQMKHYAVKGYVNLHCSMDELGTAIDMVFNRKGTFLKFVN